MDGVAYAAAGISTTGSAQFLPVMTTGADVWSTVDPTARLNLSGLNCSDQLALWQNYSIDRGDMTPECTKPKYSVAMTVFIVVLLGLIGVGTAFGNTLVILAVALVKKLQSPSNLLIVSLAASDLLVGCTVVPLAIVKQTHTYWPLDNSACDIFIICDVLLCTSSILNLTAISVDRYLVITRPFQYAVKRTPGRMGLMIILVWVSSAMISIPPVIGWKRKYARGECEISDDLGYQLYATMGAFYLPLVIMLVLYGRIFKLAHRMATADAKQKVNTFNKKEDDETPDETTLLQKERQIRFTVADDGNTCAKETDGTEQCTVAPNGQAKKYSDQSSSASDLVPARNAARQRQPARKKKQKSNSETKAIKTLGVIMGCFTLCWLPFFIIAIIAPIFKVSEIPFMPPRALMDIFVWLGYMNSFMNPIIYAKFNRDFRTPFKEILLFHCASINNRLRSESYAAQYGLPMHGKRTPAPSPGTNRNRRKSSDLVTSVNRKGQITSSLGNGVQQEHI